MRMHEIICEADTSKQDKAALQAEVKTLCDALEAKFPGLKLWCSIGPSGDLGLSQIVVPKRSQGTGSAVMQILIDFADQHSLPMTLTPDSSYGGSVTRLRKFYGRFGFRPNAGRRKDFRFSGTMLRRPQ
jgi:hypothetical protein